jgi:hypothetical protein
MAATGKLVGVETLCKHYQDLQAHLKKILLYLEQNDNTFQVLLNTGSK